MSMFVMIIQYIKFYLSVQESMIFTNWIENLIIMMMKVYQMKMIMIEIIEINCGWEKYM